MEIITKYEIMTGFAECKGHIEEYYPGYGCDKNVITDPEWIRSYRNKEDALNALNQHSCSAHEFNSPSGAMLKVKEYWVEKNSYGEEDGELYEQALIAFAEPSALTKSKMPDKVSDVILKTIDKNVETFCNAYKTDWYDYDRLKVRYCNKDDKFIVMLRDTGVDTAFLSGYKCSYANIRQSKARINLNSSKKYLYYNGKSLTIISKNIASNLCDKAFSSLPPEYVKEEELKRSNQKYITLYEYLKERGCGIEPQSPKNTQSR